jgi:aspartyl/asparaginyl-tRNA synthetase
MDLGMKNVDLFMLTPSVSSPMGPGSDSEPIQVRIGDLDTNLVDSSQFGFEPLLLNGLNAAYCYLPSMRGEESDERHLSQFFHCEAEIVGTLEDLLPLVEGYVRSLASAMLELPRTVQRISSDPDASRNGLERVVQSKSFPSLTLDDAIEMLSSSGRYDGFSAGEFGRDLTPAGERALFEISGIGTPLWVRNFDRDRVAFYQKPLPADQGKVITADLLFPPLTPKGFSGEIAGAGQRQDSATEMLESLRRQGISPDPYQWYVALRELEGYRTTSGFGLGIERFLAWFLCEEDIRKVIPYPRLKNVLTHP